MTIIIFVVTLTKGAPAFPLILIALVPVRLLLMKKFWRREVLRFVDAWACREGTPEDEEDERARVLREEEQSTWEFDGQEGMEMGVLGRDKKGARSTRKQDDGEDIMEQAQ